MAVHQRGKKGPVTVERDWEGNQGPIHLLVRASLDDWKKLLSVNDTVRSWIFEGIVDEAKAKVETSARNLPRGLSKEEFNFVQKMKRAAIFTFAIIGNYSETNFYKKLVEKFGQKMTSPGKRRKPKLHELHKLTAFVLDQIFAKEKIKYLIRRDWAKNPDNFRRTYLDLSKLKKEIPSYFRTCFIDTIIVLTEFKPYIKKSKNPLEAFELFFKEKSYLLRP
jgi:hypothetical protein